MTEAFKLMLTGMSTVFLILIFVVLLGHLIIMVTNKLNETKAALSPVSSNDSLDVSPNKLAAIIAAVEVTTLGNGKIASIKKIDKK
jgi:oxaloacetate decarboxylase gamma subunit